jgi:transcriptional regulator GlxA family with amidase domain
MISRSAPRAIPVYVIVPPNVVLLDVAGPIEVLRQANLRQDAVRYNLCYCGPAVTCDSSVGLTLTDVQALPDRLPDDATVILPGRVEPNADDPAGTGPREEAEHEIIRWLADAVRPGVRLISICSGALLAARAGLLDGYECTTHHGSVADLKTAAPNARVRENRLFVEDGERLTSAGITTGIDLMLHVISQTVGHAVTLAVARYLVVYLRRAGEDPQLSPWLEGRNHVHPAVHRVQDAVICDPARDWSVAMLAREAGASSRNLSRLFNQHAGLSVTEYVNRMRIALVRDLLSTTRLDMEAIADRTGFSSPRQLRRAWHRYYPAPPRELRQQMRDTS